MTASPSARPPAARQLAEFTRESYGTRERLAAFFARDVPASPPGIDRVDEWRLIALENLHVFAAPPDGTKALDLVAGVFLDLFARAGAADVRDRCLGGLFEFLKKIIDDSGARLEMNLPAVDRALERISAAIPEGEGTIKKAARTLKGILAAGLEKNIPLRLDLVRRLIDRAALASFDFWIDQPDPAGDPAAYVPEDIPPDRELIARLVEPLSRSRLRAWRDAIAEKAAQPEPRSWNDFADRLEVPDDFQIAHGYLKIADEIERAPFTPGRAHAVRLRFLLGLLSHAGFQSIHRETLIEVNRSLSKVFPNLAESEVEPLIATVFRTFRESTARAGHPDTMMSCISTAAREVFKLDRHSAVKALLEDLIRFGFIPPGIRGATLDWEIQYNPLHVKNIRAWLEIIALKPRWTKPLLSALIAHLQIGGVFVRDADLLQKDISALLSADIRPAHNLVLQLARILPVYYNDINAGGELRENTTRLDALSYREDPLLHFLRKQTHVECNSTLVPFLEAVIRFWAGGDKAGLKPYLPAEIYDGLAASGRFYDGLHRIMAEVDRIAGGDVRGLLTWDAQRILRTVGSIAGVSETDREKAALSIRLYQILHRKYFIQHQDVIKDLETAYLFERRKTDALKKALIGKNHLRSMDLLLDVLAGLKDRFLSAKKTEALEDLYEKRHIAVGIPSIYGSYREEKFDALRLYLKLQSLAEVELEKVLEPINLRFITQSTLAEIQRRLKIFLAVFSLEGIATEGLESKVRLLDGALKARRFSLAQYTDIFQFISKGIQDVIRTYYVDAHRAHLPLIIRQILAGRPEAERPKPGKEEEEAVFMRTEDFLRALISSAFGLQAMDRFVSTILRTLCAEEKNFPNRTHVQNVVLSYDPNIALSPIGRRFRAEEDQILLGNKGYFLKKLHGFGFPVPPGFILTTEIFRCREAIQGYRDIARDFEGRIGRELKAVERATRKKLGDPRRPLLLSVRSGSAISSPGMMTSFLNVGMNEPIAEALAARPRTAWAAWDCYRRILQFWGMSEGLSRDFFDDIIDRHKKDFGVDRKIAMSPEQMRDLALAYRKGLEENGVAFIDDPREQLNKACFKVLDSWDSPRAGIFRAEMNLSHEWGSAVIVQAMVFGNLDADSGTGVIFTRDPKSQAGSVSLSGDFTRGAQGDDVVTGLVETLPISESQRMGENRGDRDSLETLFPEVYAELKRLSEHLVYERGFEHQEIEFTFEHPSREGLWILQTRDLLPPETRRRKAFAPTKALDSSSLGHGIGISGGALSGRAVFSEADIETFGKDEPPTALILIRPDTVPDDIGLLRRVDGLLTAKGGSTSHAAVIIPQLKKVGVVGLRALSVDEKNGRGTIHGTVVRSGDWISLDGWSGAVYRGRHRLEGERSPAGGK